MMAGRSLALLAALCVAISPVYSDDYRALADFLIYGWTNPGLCDQCIKALDKMKTPAESDQMLRDAVEACKSTKFFTARICDEEYRIYAGSVQKIVTQRKESSEETCKFLTKGFCGEPTSKSFNWELDLDALQTEVEAPEGIHVDHHGDRDDHKRKHDHMAFLHITDTHFDDDYDVGADANCNEPLCCTKYQNQTKNATYFAGPWGHPLGMACDIPVRTVENMFKDIHKRRKVDYVIWTGDISSHSYIGMTKERAMSDIKITTDMFKKYLRHTRVFPALGNHDAFPDRLFPQPNVDSGAFSVQPLYEDLWGQWSQWLPKDQEKTFKYGGFYTALVKPGFRIISLNTNFCYVGNWWLALGANDPAKQLEWLNRQLKSAARRKEMVHIIGHIPPGTPGCNQYWEEAYFKTVTKYSKIITGQFFAHIHLDEVVLDYSDPANPEKATSVVYVSPVVTTSWSGMPEYRIFHTQENAEIADIETYFLNLTEANSVYMKQRDWLHEKVHEYSKNHSLNPYATIAMEKVIYGDPSWKLGYSAKKAYGLKDFSPESWHNLLKKFDTDDNLLQTFYRHHTQFRENVMRQERPCDAKCKNDLLNFMKSSRSHRAEKKQLPTAAMVTTLSTLIQEAEKVLERT